MHLCLCNLKISKFSDSHLSHRKRQLKWLSKIETADNIISTDNATKHFIESPVEKLETKSRDGIALKGLKDPKGQSGKRSGRRRSLQTSDIRAGSSHD